MRRLAELTDCRAASGPEGAGDRHVETEPVHDGDPGELALGRPVIGHQPGKLNAPRAEGRRGKVWTMRFWIAGCLALGLAGCNQTANQSGPGSPGADASLEALPPIYEPVVDVGRIKESKYRLDPAACRHLALPQERAARAAAQQAEVGAVLSLAGSVIGAVPASNLRQAHALGSTSDTLQDIGDSAAANGAASAGAALNTYALVVNTCLRHRGYRLLR